MQFFRTKKHFFYASEKGQAMLFVIVAMVIALTITLSVASRSVTNVKTSTEEANSQQAFSAAEAGVEQALRQSGTGMITPAQVNTQAKIQQLSIQTVSGSDLALNNKNDVLRDDGIDLWLSTYPTYASPWPDGKINIYWGSSTDCTAAAIEVIVVTGTATNPVTTRYTFDSCPARRGQNNFSAPGAGKTLSTGDVFANGATIPPSGVITTGLFVRIIPLYADAKIGVEGRTAANANNPFPAQGTKIQSVASSGQSSRKLTVNRGYPKIPNEFFANVLFSP